MEVRPPFASTRNSALFGFGPSGQQQLHRLRGRSGADLRITPRVEISFGEAFSWCTALWMSSTETRGVGSCDEVDLEVAGAHELLEENSSCGTRYRRARSR